MTFPRRLTPSDKERATIVQQRMTPGGALGVGSRHVRRSDGGPSRTATNAQGIEVVFHGDDGTVDRPDAPWVIWIGAATPANAADYDGWYTATIA